MVREKDISGWYKIVLRTAGVEGLFDERVICNVRSKGLAHIVLNRMREIYHEEKFEVYIVE